MKGKSKPELYVAFHMGMKPKDLIAKGYAVSTVYNYFWRYNKKQGVKEAIINLVSGSKK